MILPKWLTIACRELGVKYCPQCKEIKPIPEFVKTASKKSGVGAYCKPCLLVRGRAYKQTPKGKIIDRKKQYRASHGAYLTEEQLTNFANNPKGDCAICHKECLLYIDHDHITLKFRDRLCRECNFALGFAEDSVERLDALIAYLRKHNA